LLQRVKELHQGLPVLLHLGHQSTGIVNIGDLLGMVFGN
jgi:hypothetical protein